MNKYKMALNRYVETDKAYMGVVSNSPYYDSITTTNDYHQMLEAISKAEAYDKIRSADIEVSLLNLKDIERPLKHFGILDETMSEAIENIKQALIKAEAQERELAELEEKVLNLADGVAYL